MLTRLLLSVSALFLTLPASAQEWTRFRGPNGSGVSDANTVPIEWTEKDLNWNVKIPGKGHGSPVVWGSKLFVNCESGTKGSERIIVCLDTKTGKELWQKSSTVSPPRKIHKKNSFASSTPAVDAEHVYVAWGVPSKISLLALTHDGDLAWEADLGTFKGGHGFAVSPIIYEDLVVLPNDQDGKSSLIAVDRKTGDTRWTVPRESKRTSYGTPCVYQPAGRPAELIFTDWSHGITAVDPKTGKVAWESGVFDTTSKQRAIGSPIIFGDLVIGTCGFVTADKRAVAVRPDSAGQIETVLQVDRQVPHIPTVLAHKGRLYMWSDRGIVSSIRLDDGKVVWTKRVGGNFLGSPVCINDRLYSVDDQGVAVVLAASDDYEELARNKFGEACHSTPAIAGGTMFVRTASHVVSVGGE
jgi:outer membrane protein assembly factor BamB